MAANEPSPARAGLREAFALYLDRRLLAIFAMGFSSGLPLPLTMATLSFWLSSRGVDKTTIGLFALVGLPYSLKFLWAPALDSVRIPFLDARLGRRRAWALVAQAALAAAIVGLGATDPAAQPTATALLALAVAFCSATQDVAVDAYRIEILAEHEQGAGAAATQAGYRVGLLSAGAGAIALTDVAPWPVIFTALAALVGVGALAELLAPAPASGRSGEGLVAAFVEPLRDLAARPAIGAIVAFALLYKFGDAIAGTMAMPFYRELGFSGTQIATASNVLGVAASAAGVIVGGAIVARVGILPTLAVGGVLQAVTNLLFAVLAGRGADYAFLALAVGADSMSGGFAGSAFVAYFSSLCRTGMSASQYALLTSLMAVGRTVMASGSGWLATQMGWAPFFVATTFLAVPGLALLWLLGRRPPATRVV